MIDREKVIKKLTVRIQSDSEEWNTIELPIEEANDILALLKEQEPMKPIYSEEKFCDFLPHCPVCKKVLPNISQYGKSNFCHVCGQAVKWDA